MTCDMAVSTGTFMRCSQPEYLNMIVDTATQGLTANFLKGYEEVKKDYKVLQKVRCKGGTPMPMSVRAELLKDQSAPEGTLQRRHTNANVGPGRATQGQGCSRRYAAKAAHQCQCRSGPS